jgi:hypothetical protein
MGAQVLAMERYLFIPLFLGKIHGGSAGQCPWDRSQAAKQIAIDGNVATGAADSAMQTEKVRL